MIVTVATYNVNACVVSAGRVDVAKVGNIVKGLANTHGATLVALQECGGGSGGHAKSIALIAGFPHYYFGSRDGSSDKRNSLAPHSGGSTCIASALVTVPGASVPFRFGSAHFPVSNAIQRMTAVGNMIQEGLKYGNYLMGGDFNASNGGIEFRCLREFNWTPSCQAGCPNTTNHAPPANNWPIDFVFSLGIPVTVSHTVIPDGTFDHQPVVVGIEI
jgi:endonuclease/exonuclease/phosphatase family metal-dependent hydrolase